MDGEEIKRYGNGRCLNSMGKIEYKINNNTSAKEIADLREAVGWNRMEECYRNPLLTSYFNISCFEKDLLIGYLDVVCNGVTDAYIQDLMVRPEYQRNGIGTNLMKMAIKKLKDDQIYMISVVFEERLLSFYKRFGFNLMMCGQMETFRCD